MARRQLWATVVAFGVFCLLLINFQSKETFIIQVAQPQLRQRVPLTVLHQKENEVEEETNDLAMDEAKEELERSIKLEQKEVSSPSQTVANLRQNFLVQEVKEGAQKKPIPPNQIGLLEVKTSPEGKDPDELAKEPEKGQEVASFSVPLKRNELPMETIKLVEKKELQILTKSGEPISFKGDIKTPKVNIEVNGHSINFTDVNVRETPQKIRIHIIFHSHVDPGWLRSFEEYYEEKVRKILSNAVASLKAYPDLRFIWSETSFLERWWRDASQEEKNLITQQITTGQLEISGGAWVMTDEATPTFYAAIENMIEGHKFIHEKFNITPKTSWSVDPFGHGAMMPELLHRAGVEAMVIGRFHEHIKQELREKQALKWRWIPPYFEELEGPRVNSLPHMVYTTEDAFENHEIGMCYHVGNSALYQGRCPQASVVSKINESNAEFMTRRFIDQMRITQKMYGSEDLLVPIGDDFFFGDNTDWEQMYKSYSAMMAWLKKHPETNAEMRFSTVSDFFNSIKAENLNTLRGDFFPYTSNMNNPYPWWTGFFVHRPFTKTMERRLQNHLRALDIVSVLSNTTRPIIMLENAKRELTLFQHHDGITGTSRPHVMADYERRMKYAFGIFSSTFVNILAGKLEVQSPGMLIYNGGDNTFTVFTIQPGQKVYISVFSSQTFKQKSLLKMFTKHSVKVEDNEGKEVPAQVRKRSDGNYEVQFYGEFAPLTITQLVLSSKEEKIKKEEPKEKCWKLNEGTGEIEALLLGSTVFPFKISLFELGDDGGAYVLKTSGNRTYVSPGKSTDFSSLFQEVLYSDYPSKNLSVRVTCLEEGDIGLEINTDLKMMSSIFMQIDADIKQDSFYTDVNGLYHLKRKYQKTYKNESLNIDANIFPVASSVFMQDDAYRLTIATGQPTGATSSRKGTLELLVDRRSTNDDGKGLGYKDCFDNRSSDMRYRIFVEKRLPSPPPQEHSFLSLSAEQKVSATLYPPILAVSSSPLSNLFNVGPTSWPCAIQLVSWRPLTDKISILILRKYNIDSTVADKDCKENSMEELYEYLMRRYKKIYHSKLSATEDLGEVNADSFKKSLSSPFAITAYRLYS